MSRESSRKLQLRECHSDEKLQIIVARTFRRTFGSCEQKLCRDTVWIF